MRGVTACRELRVVDASSGGDSTHARNQGAASARGDLLAFGDADDEATPDGSRASPPPRPPPTWSAVRWTMSPERRRERVLDPARHSLGFRWRMASSRTHRDGNCAVWARLAGSCIGTRPTGSEPPTSSSPGEPISRATIAFAPGAVMRRGRPTVRALARKYFAYGGGGPLVYRHFRAAGMPRSYSRKPLRAWGWLLGAAGQPSAELSRTVDPDRREPVRAPRGERSTAVVYL